MASTWTFESMAPDMTARVAECAYYKAERRGFAPGFELDDWLEAEREISAMTAATAPKVSKKKTRGKNGAAKTRSNE